MYLYSRTQGTLKNTSEHNGERYRRRGEEEAISLGGYKRR